MTFVILFFVLQWYLSLFMQTAFLHRYAAHKMFTMGPFVEKLFFFFTWVFQGPSYLSANAYGAMHRMHHAHADTEDDPHSPSYDKNVFAMMWRTAIIYTNIFYRKITVDQKYTKNLPEWRSFDLFASSWVTRVGVGTLYTLLYVLAAPPLWMYVFLPLQWIMGPLHGAIINWCAHKWGYRNFKTTDTSRNFLPFDFLMMGESYHNNHHAQQKNPNFGVRFFELDPSYPVIKLLDLLGVIQLAPKELQEAK